MRRYGSLEGRLKALEQQRPGTGLPPMWAFECARQLCLPMDIQRLYRAMGRTDTPNVSIDPDALEAAIASKARELAATYRSAEEALRGERALREHHRQSFAIDQLKRVLETMDEQERLRQWSSQERAAWAEAASEAELGRGGSED